MTPDQLTELRRLEAAATPGPWEKGGPYPWCTVIVCVDGGSPGYYEAPEPPTYEPVCVVYQPPENDYDTPPPEQAVADMKLITALRNAAPDLLRAAEVVAACERWGIGAERRGTRWVPRLHYRDQDLFYCSLPIDWNGYHTFADAVLAAAKWLEERELQK